MRDVHRVLIPSLGRGYMVEQGAFGDPESCMTAVLLLEIIVSSQFTRASSFPFIQGFLRTRGVPTRWIRFASRHAIRAEGGSGFSLSPEDLQVLRGLVAATATPTHVLVSHEPARDLLAALLSVAPGVRVGWVNDQAEPGHPTGGLEPCPVFPDLRSVATFVGLPVGDEGNNLFEEAVPDFSFEPANAEASTAPPLPYLICGPDCSYRRSLSTNPFFAGVDLAGCDERGGCAFCLRPARDAQWTRPPEEVMTRQLDAVARVWKGARDRLLVRAIGETFLKRIETFASLAAVRPLPPCDFLLDGRADLLIARRAHLEEALRILQPTAHRIHIALVGVENFSDTELRRMNKGTTGIENLALAHLLLRLERDYPSTFAFRQWGGLSLILFTPWTRPQDLAFNLSVIETARIEAFCGKVFSGRLRLMPRLPLHRLAEHDHLLVPAYEDPRLDTTRSNPYASLYPEEIPWRFADPRMDSVCRVIVRMAAPPVPGDPVDDALDRAFRRIGPKSHGIGFALGVVDVAVMADEPRDPLDLVEATAVWRGQEGRNWIREDHTGLGTPLDPDLAVRFTMMAARIGVKPVARLEGKAARSSLPESSGLSIQRVEIRGEPVLFCGLEAAQVEEAALAAMRQTREARDEAEPSEEALIREGLLLGYPECCVRAFAAREGAIRDHDLWPHIQRRVEADDEVSPLFNPGYLPLVEHVPCSLGCRESLSRAERLLAAWQEEAGERAARDLLRTLSHPWLFLTEGEEHRIELIPEDEPTERFRYRPGLWAGDHPLIRCVLDGDEVVLDETGLSILRRGSLRAALGCRGFLWWHRRAFHRDWWRWLMALRFDPRREPDLDPAARRQSPEGDSSQEKARRLAAFLASTLTKDIHDFEGFYIARIEPWAGPAVRLTLRSGQEQMALIIEPHAPGRPAYLKVGPLAISHPDGAPLDTPAKVRAVRQLSARLRASLARRTSRS